MIQFLFEYGLFAAKTFTLIFLILAALIIIIGLVTSKHKEQETLEIENINDRLEDLQDNLEQEIYSKSQLKELKKQKKKLEKQKKAEDKERNRLFIIRFNGDMHASEVDSIRESITAILSVAKEKDEVLVILDSSGGLVHNYGLAASQLQRIRDHKLKLTCAIDLVAASGGYMMACVANYIIAAPFAVVGSIGVLAQLPNFNRLLKHYNIDIEHHTAGEYKSTLTMLGSNTNKDRAKFKEELEETHVLFKQFVQQNRPQLEVDKIATGEHWFANDAIKLKLIDKIQTSDDYIIANSKKFDIFEINYTFRETFTDKISSLLHNTSAKFVDLILQKFSKKTKEQL